jgi:nucleotidyltransferase substrate binding protein (TIGR01987 family)
MKTGDPDIRWVQRFAKFKKALEQLKKFVDKGNLNELEQQGLIKAFEYTFELSWNVIKDYYEYQGVAGIQGSRDAFRIAFNRGLVEDGESWQAMVDDRVNTSHTYNEEIAHEISEHVLKSYFFMFESLKEKLEAIRQDGVT